MKKILTFLGAAILLLALLTGCGGQETTGVTVQSVSMLAGLQGAGQVNRYAGIVTAGKQTDVKKDDSRTVAKVLVAVGDSVTKGQTLFTYDTATAQLDLDKAQLQYQQMQLDIEAQETQKAQLEQEKAAATADGQLSYTTEINAIENALREARYNLTLQQKEIDRLRTAMGENEVKSPMDGRVLAVNENGGTDSSGNAKPLVSLVETGGYQIKGRINEMNRTDLPEGTSVIIRSRVDDTVLWKGSVSRIDWENPVSGSGSSSGVMMDKTMSATGGASDSSAEMTAASKYPFYVTVEGGEGLLLGQHVLIEPDYGQTDTQELRLPTAFFTDVSGDAPWVWAASAQNKLEKRTVRLTDYDEQMDTWLVTEGLTAEDYIAFPDDTLKAGAAVSRLDVNAFDTMVDSDSAMSGMGTDMPGGSASTAGVAE